MDDPTLSILALLGLAALTAGFVDAVVGGGGLIQLPALLLGLPAASPVEVLATNKLASICGTTVSSATYYRRIRPDPKTFGPLMLLAFVGSMAGAAVAFLIPRDAFEPIVLVALILVGAYVLFKPTSVARPSSGSPATGTLPRRCSPGSASASTTARSGRAPAASS